MAAFTALAVSVPALAQPAWLKPDAVFVQHGRTADDTRAWSVGLAWDDAGRRWRLARGEVSLHWEFGLGHWSTPGLDDGRDSAVVTQLEIAPVWRWRADEGRSPWFVEGAIGLALIAPLYQSRAKRFSTRLNFADHVALGRDFGARRQHQLALRFEHFSNGGLRKPNPGENFLQLRYAWRWP